MNCLHVLVSVASLHLGMSGLNQHNPGIFLQCNHFEVGHYYNSERRYSNLIGYTGNWFMVGLVSGYSHNSSWFPLPYVAVHHKFGAVDIVAIPLMKQENIDAGYGKPVGVVFGLRLQLK